MKRLALLMLAPLLVAAGDPANETEHVVEAGETLGGIANRAQVPAAAIAAANGLVEPYAVKTGQKLQIPRQRRHTVKPGETGFAVAMQYGVPFDLIAIANGLEPPYVIRSGQVLIVPAVLKPAPAPKAGVAASTPAQPYFRWPHDGAVLLGYARRPGGGGHDGLDIAVKPGDMVRAAASGTVTYAGEEPKRFGHMVVIDHGNGWQSAYGHLDRVTVSKGEVVKTGERLGIGGQGGSAERPELHFAIRHRRQPVDPADVLPARTDP